MHVKKVMCVAALISAALGGCQSVPPAGDYTVFLREVMVASRELSDSSSEASHRSEQAERAVGAWRSAAENEDD